MAPCRRAGSGARTAGGGVSNVDIDGNNTIEIKAIEVAISTFETLPTQGEWS
jgi:hypothetical protein